MTARTMPAQNPGSSKQDYATPDDFIAAVTKRFGDLAFDLAADSSNARAEKFYTKEDNSLVQDWTALRGNLWLNPEFADIDPWAKQCAQSAIWMPEHESDRKIFLLTPASVGANWFCEWVYGRARVFFLNGRLTFIGQDDPYPKDCILSVFGLPPGFEVWRWKPERVKPVAPKKTNGAAAAAEPAPPPPTNGVSKHNARKLDAWDRAEAAALIAENDLDTIEQITIHVAPIAETPGAVPNGPLPAHVLPDLGEHPSLTDPQTRLAFVERAMAMGFLQSDPSESLESAWIRLQYVAPVGFFRVDPRTPPTPKPIPGSYAVNPTQPENLGALCGKLRELGITVDLKTLAGWSVNDRGAVFDWVMFGGQENHTPRIILEELARQRQAAVNEMPVVAGCAGCANGVPFNKENAYKHTGEGPHCTTDTSALAATVDAEAAPKRKPGRPRKNKGGDPNAWERAALVAEEERNDLGPGLV